MADAKSLAYTAEQIDERLGLVPKDYAVRVPVSAWSSSSPYSATVSVPGVAATDIITDAVPDLSGLSGSAISSAITAASAWTTVSTAANALTFSADAKPTAEIRLIIRIREGAST